MKNNRIDRWISQISTFSDMVEGISRTSYSPSYEKALLFLIKEMKKLGMSTRVDGIGNLIGQYNPSESTEKPIGIGSHLDTVKNGGAFDGIIGISVGLEIIHRAFSKGIAYPRPIEIIAFIEEEGGLFGRGCIGSEYITGNIPLNTLESLGDTSNDLRKLVRKIKLNKCKFPEDYAWGKNYYHSFYEVHCEQGERLIKESKRIGIVTGVVGILRNLITFHGQPNHAGTTAMNKRKDASLPMAELILSINQIGQYHMNDIVATTGHIDLSPNQHNVIPGKAKVTLELRGDNDKKIVTVLNQIQKEAKRIAKKHGLMVEIDDYVFTPVKLFDTDIIDRISIAAGNDPEVTRIFSWAGHDAKIMSYANPTGMIFVPSLEGLSHCPEEFTSLDDILKAIEILENTIYNS